MRPSPKPTCGNSAKWKLGLVLLSALLPLLIIACASSNKLAQKLRENQGSFLTPLASPDAAAKPVKKDDPLKLAAAVADDNLENMRGCLGVYYFNYDFDVNLQATPQVKINSTFQAVTPDGTAPATNGPLASFNDGNVQFQAGPNSNGSNGLGSMLVVTGQNNIVFSNATFNFHMPNASVLSSSVNVLPANSLSGLK